MPPVGLIWDGRYPLRTGRVGAPDAMRHTVMPNKVPSSGVEQGPVAARSERLARCRGCFACMAPLERHALAGHFLERLAVGVDGFKQTFGAPVYRLTGDSEGRPPLD